MRGIIPIPRDNMNEIIFSAGPSNVITNVSTNGYYGYQPQSHYYAKNGTHTTDEGTSRCDMEMELEQPQEGNIQMQKNIPRQFDRKRRWEHRDDAEIFKKRREQEKKINMKKQLPNGDKDNKLLEEILQETHGVTMYHWLCNEI